MRPIINTVGLGLNYTYTILLFFRKRAAILWSNLIKAHKQFPAEDLILAGIKPSQFVGTNYRGVQFFVPNSCCELLRSSQQKYTLEQLLKGLE